MEDATLCAAGFLGPPFIGLTALSGWPGLGLAGGSAFRASGPAKPLRPGPASGLTACLDSIAETEFESVESSFAKDLESRVLSLGFSSEGVASSSLLAAEELLASVEDGKDELPERDSSSSGAGGADLREAVSPGRSGNAGDVT
jgi:hypothetical protein